METILNISQFELNLGYHCMVWHSPVAGSSSSYQWASISLQCTLWLSYDSQPLDVLTPLLMCMAFILLIVFIEGNLIVPGKAYNKKNV